MTGTTALGFGLGIRDITPAPGADLWGYTNRTGPATGVLDPLYAKAMVFDDGTNRAAVVVVDLGRAPTDDIRAEIAARAAKVGVGHVTILATHTHHGPVMEDSSAAHVGPIREAIVGSIEDGVAKLEPVALHEGAAAFDIGHNRRIVEDGACRMLWRNEARIPTAPVDREARLLQIRATGSNALRCTLVHHACHPVVMGPSNLGYSADWPGEMCRIVGEWTGAPAVFLQGGCGDINPYFDKSDVAAGGVEAMLATGRDAAEGVIRGLASIRPMPAAAPSVRWMERPVCVGTRWDFSNAQQRALFASFYGEIFEKCYVEGTGRDLTVALDLVMLNGTVAFVGVPGEIFTQDQLMLKATGPCRHTLVCGYANGYFGYFPPVRDAIAGGYGGTVGSLAGWGAADRLMLEAKLGLVALLGEADRPATDNDFAIVDA